MVKKFKAKQKEVEEIIRVKHKSKTPKRMKNSISDTKDAQDQPTPRKIRHMLTSINIKKKSKEAARVAKKSATSAILTEKASLDDQLKELNHSTYKTAQKNTK